jgi:DNA-directed RNA polymerase sigma subunit (sigma70/sigma32)
VACLFSAANDVSLSLILKQEEYKVQAAIICSRLLTKTGNGQSRSFDAARRFGLCMAQKSCVPTAEALSGDEHPLSNHDQNFDKGRMMGIDDSYELLSDDEIVNERGLKRGCTELKQIFLEGLFAQDTLIRSNVRLVISIEGEWQNT